MIKILIPSLIIRLILLYEVIQNYFKMSYLPIRVLFSQTQDELFVVLGKVDHISQIMQKLPLIPMIPENIMTFRIILFLLLDDFLLL